MRNRRDPYVLVVRHGPYYGLENPIHFGKSFGGRFDGELCTFGHEKTQVDAGRFRIIRFKLNDHAGILPRGVYVLRVLSRALRARWILRRRVVVIAYDPFQSGVIGLLAKWLAGARLICEVNGFYGDPENLIDIPDSQAREDRRLKMLKLGSFVLRRAHMIKILFPGQLAGFSIPEGHPPRRCFFDMVDESWFEGGEAEPDNLFLFVGHPFMRKGVDVLLQAFARVFQDFPDWSLVIVGWGIEKVAEKSGYPTDGVRFFGPMAPDALAGWMRRAKALVLPSRSEGLARVLIEAAFTGRARIASRIAGTPQVVEHGVDGLLFDSGDVDGLESQLRRFISDPELQARLGDAAFRRAQGELTTEVYLDRYSEAISALMAPGS